MSDKVDLTTVRAAMSDLFAVTKDLHGRRVSDVEPQFHRKEVAEVTRDLLNLADSLDLLAGLVRQEYWSVKGYARITEPTE